MAIHSDSGGGAKARRQGHAPGYLTCPALLRQATVSQAYVKGHTGTPLNPDPTKVSKDPPSVALWVEAPLIRGFRTAAAVHKR